MIHHKQKSVKQKGKKNYKEREKEKGEERKKKKRRKERILILSYETGELSVHDLLVFKVGSSSFLW